MTITAGRTHVYGLVGMKYRQFINGIFRNSISDPVIMFDA